MTSLLTGILSSASAQDPPQDKSQDVLEADYAEYRPDGNRTLAYIAGNVIIRRGDVGFRADRILAWVPLHETVTPQKLEEVYAEGNVVFRRGNRELKAERIFFSFKDDRALVINLRARGHDPVLGTSFQVMADLAREINKGEFEAEDVSITTCDYGVPHYDVVIRHATILGKGPLESGSGIGVPRFSNWSVHGTNISPRFDGIPFFFIPGFGFTTGIISDFPLRTLEVGKTTQFGLFELATLGFGIKKGQIDRIVPWGHPNDETEHIKWGDILVHADYRQIRGAAGGIDLLWKWDDYHGYIKSYYLQDQGRADTGFDSKFEPLDRPQRGRVRMFHRQDIPSQESSSQFLPAPWRYELEASYISDRDLLEEFFPKEFWEGKEQENAAYVRWLDGNLGAYAYERHRINGFQTQVEFMPKLNFELVEQPVAPWLSDRLLFTQTAQVAHLRLRPDEESILSGDRVWRLDAYNELSFPMDLNVVQVSPFVAQRTTFYEQDLENERELRTIESVGGRVRTVVYGTHDLHWEGMGVRGLRHIMETEVRYANNLVDNVGPGELFEFDEVDRLSQYQELALIFRNRLQTKVKEGDGFKSWEFLDTMLAMKYYPQADRDTVGFQETGHEPPFYWLNLAPTVPGAPLESRHVSNLYWEFNLRPRYYFTLTAFGEYNPVDHEEEIRAVGVTITPSPAISFAIGENYVQHVTNTYTLSMMLTLGEKWTVRGFLQYDILNGQYTQQTLAVGRDFHDFIIEAVFENNVGRDDRRIYLALVPKFLGPAQRSASLDARQYKSPP